MELIDPPLSPEIWAATPAAAQALIVALQQCIRDLETYLGQTSANSSRPPSSDPPEAPARPKAPLSGRRRGGPPGHRGTFRRLLTVVATCRHQGRSLLQFLVAAGEATLQGSPPPSLLPTSQGAEWLPSIIIDRRAGDDYPADQRRRSPAGRGA